MNSSNSGTVNAMSPCRAVDHSLADQFRGALLINPQSGDLMTGTGGLREGRWNQTRRGKGKRSGIRVIYYWYDPANIIYMLLAYSQDEQDDLSASQKRILKKVVQEEFA